MSWLIPFVKRSSSFAYNVNFLFHDKNVYFSDNHRTALWCWMKHLNKGENVALFHIDRHYDTLTLGPDYINSFPGVFNLGSIKDYLDLKATIGKSQYPLIRWDNYLSFFIAENQIKNNIDCIYLATHKDGTYPENPHGHHIEEIEIYELLNDIDSSFENHEKIILNVDLDYFFTDKHENYIQLIDNQFISELFKRIKNQIDIGKIICLTICLSPECCGGWNNAEHVLDIVKRELNINFTL